ncbi:MAG TPA: M23 family metallopeptidase [Thermoanaerobaculia bacterium]
MRKLRRAGRAGAFLAVALAWPMLTKAETQHKGATPKTAPAPSRKSASKVSQPKKRAPQAGKSEIAAAAKVSHRRKKAKRAIHQDSNNQVVLEWLEAARPRPVYGPVLPPSTEVFDYPRPPCAAEDVVVEARLHDDSPDAEASEEGATDETVDASRTARLVAIARRFTSLLRPKSASARVTPEDVDMAELLRANLRIPVEGVDAEKLRDSFLDRRDRYRKHLAIDIGAPRGTPVLATAAGEIIRLAREKRGGITIYQKDPTGKYLFFYCHLSRYAKGLAVGQRVQAGDVIGYVGSTGHVIGGPHLHFSITRVPEDDDFREGLAVNPYLLFLAGVP